MARGIVSAGTCLFLAIGAFETGEHGAAFVLLGIANLIGALISMQELR